MLREEIIKAVNFLCVWLIYLEKNIEIQFFKTIYMDDYIKKYDGFIDLLLQIEEFDELGDCEQPRV